VSTAAPPPGDDWGPGARAGLASLLRERGLLGDGRTAAGLTIRRIGDGHSNLTFAVTDGTSRVVVRRPPPPPEPPGAHDVLREAAFMHALRDSLVPVPAVLATARAGEVTDVPCYVMGFVDGPVVTTAMPVALSLPVVRQQAGQAMIDTLADLHMVDWRAAGLAGLGRPDGFNARHLRRISALVQDQAGRLLPRFAVAGAWLAAHVPPESGAAIVHGDYRIGNLVLAPGPPGRIAAVLDWELATIGDPLLDVAYFLGSVPEPGQPRTPVQDMGTALLEDGWPGRAELAARYVSRTGADLSGLAWYAVLAQWKLAALYEYSRRRAEAGGDGYYGDPSLVTSFLRAAHRAAGLGPVPAAGPEKDTR
jgi:aminoglycoside phosphotransferase (APT) family kinase protein